MLWAAAVKACACVRSRRASSRRSHAVAPRRPTRARPNALPVPRHPPYHSTREDFFKRMSTEEEAARAELDAFVKYVLPTVEALNAHFVAQELNFADKA